MRRQVRCRHLEPSNADHSLSVSRLVRLLQRREHRALSAELPAQAAYRGTGRQLFAMRCGMVGYLAFHFDSSNEKSSRRAGVLVDGCYRAVLGPGNGTSCIKAAIVQALDVHDRIKKRKVLDSCGQ